MYQSLEQEQLLSFTEHDYGRATKHAAALYRNEAIQRGEVGGMSGCGWIGMAEPYPRPPLGLLVSVWATAPKLFEFVLKKGSEIAPRRR
jgi:hypothetical protein